jgi:hypothetical protein
MVPIINIVVSPDCEWAVIYFVSNISDKKVWAGKDYMSDAIHAISNLFGCQVFTYSFTNEYETADDTPEKFGDIKGIERLGQA